jgi:Cu-processing system ATP-binding protein
MNLEVNNISKSFGKQQVLRSVNVEFTKPGITAILGPNGSGKTTLIKSILGMVIPDEGDILLANKSVLGEWKYRYEIDYLPQIANFPENLRYRELLDMVKDIRTGSFRDKKLNELFGLEPFLDKKMGQLSGGTKQKANIVLALMYENSFIILDEPSTGLDPLSHIAFKNFLNAERESGKTILVTTHIMDFVEDMADRIVFLLDGKIYFDGTLNELNENFGQKKLENTIAEILKLENKHA